jgi:uncharacterized protein YbaA (DUF1428 family)
MEAYRAWAENGARFFRDHGCLEIVECWEDFIPDGKQTDFRRAVAAKAGEKIVFTWQIWPDEASFQAAEDLMHEDERMDTAGEPPFDARRLFSAVSNRCFRWAGLELSVGRARRIRARACLGTAWRAG